MVNVGEIYHRPSHGYLSGKGKPGRRDKSSFLASSSPARRNVAETDRCRRREMSVFFHGRNVERFKMVRRNHEKPVLGCPKKLGSMVRINGLFHLLINRVYWGFNPLTNRLLTSWDIQVSIDYSAAGKGGYIVICNLPQSKKSGT